MKAKTPVAHESDSNRPGMALQGVREGDSTATARGRHVHQRLIDQSPRVLQQQAYEQMIEQSPVVQQHAMLQQSIDSSPRVQQQKAAVSHHLAPSNPTGLPGSLKTGIESLSGLSMDHVKVHYNSSEPARMQARAYARGTQIHLGPGEERHLPHEAWHVVQQAQGRVPATRQMKGAVPLNDDSALEQEADVMGAQAVRVGGDTGADTDTDPTEAETAPLGEALSGPVQRNGSDDEREDDAESESESEPEPEPALDLSTLPKVSEPLTIGAAEKAAQTGDLIDRILHEVAVRVADIFEEEVPFDARNLSLEKLKGPPPSDTQSKRAKKAAQTASAKTKKPTASSKSEADKKPDPSPHDEARKKLQGETGSGQRLNATVTQILLELQHLRRLYMTALLGQSTHSRGSNVFTWSNLDFVVKAKGRYVAPLKNETSGREGELVDVPDSYFNAYDYPRNELSYKDLKAVIEDMLAGDLPQLDAGRLTTFIAAIGAEISRYRPQIVSLVLALSGVTTDVDAHQKSVFTSGLTMTTGSTDPGSGSHIDNRPGFAGQPEENRATDRAAVREGAILRAAFSHSVLKLDVAAYVRQRVEALGPSPTLEACRPIIDDLAHMLIFVMNRQAAKSVHVREPQTIRLEDHLTEKARRDHFPEDFQFPSRSVDDSSIVLLSPSDRVRLATELSRHNWEKAFRSTGLYDVASRTKGSKQILYGKATIRLTNQDGPTSFTKNGNHWAGHTWVGEHKSLSPDDFQKAVKQKQGEALNERGARAPVRKPHERISDLYRLLDGKEDKDKRALNEQLARILASLDKNGNLEAVQGEVSALEEQLSSRDANLRALLLGSLPSNEWGLMPRSWQRHEASGLGHNCLIDSLLQHVTNLAPDARRQEAAAIRQQLIRERRTRPLEYLSAHEHGERVLQLIGVDPSQYEVRTEWTSGGLVQVRETLHAGAPQVIRLWNTGGHYEPITVTVDNPLVDDIEANQTNTPTLRAAAPLWLRTTLDDADEQTLTELEKEQPEEYQSDRATTVGYVRTTVDHRSLYTFPGSKPPSGETRFILREPGFDPESGAAALKEFLDTYEIPYAEVTIYTRTHVVRITGVQTGNEASPYVFKTAPIAAQKKAPAKKTETATTE